MMACRRDYWAAAMAFTSVAALIGAVAAEATAPASTADVEHRGLGLISAVLGSSAAAADTGITPSASELSSNFWAAFVNSVSMILVTEIGDKTFFIAAVLAMRYDRILVFAGAIGALIFMTILSAAIGNVLPNLLPRKYTHYASAMLFLYFGLKLLHEARGMEADGPSDELEEVEQELIHKKEGTSATQLENGDGPTTPTGGSSGKHRGFDMNGGSYKVFTQAFTLTFLAEWGDRSQIATIALAAAKDPIGVTAGGVVGHAMCTGLAVVGGRMLAARISERTVAMTGGVLFLVFCLHSLIVGP